MKRALLLSVLSMGLLSSCSTAFKAGQTPDDVYYSPGADRAMAKEEVSREDEQQYKEYISSMDDRYLRMKVANRYRWSSIDNFDYWYDSRYDFSTYNPYNSYGYYNGLSPYNSWNPGWGLSLGGYGYRNYYPGYGWSHPLYTVVHYGTPSYGGGGYTSGSNISAYKNRSYDNTNYGIKDAKSGAVVPSNSNSSFGSLMKKVFSAATPTESAQSYDRAVRTYTPPANNNTPATTAPATSSSAGGSSAGYGSTGSSTSSGRGGRGN